jgi:MYXO-CTERM domain-containing protein
MRRSLCAGIAALALGLAQANATTIYAPDAIVAGQSIADWTEGWWTWAAGLPDPGNAFDDQTGALAHQNNNGPVFYAAGYFFLEPPVSRAFSIAAGQPILIPLINQGAFQLPQADESAVISSFQASSLTAILDGTPVANPSQYSQTTNFFSAGPIMPNTLGANPAVFATPRFPGVPPNCPPTDLCPALSTGYWLMLSLSPGTHVIDTGGTASVTIPPDLGGSGYTFSVATDYTITAVAPEPASGLLMLPGLLGLFALRRRGAQR